MGEFPSEIAEHIVVAQYLLSLDWVLFTHPPLGGFRFISTARLLKRMGASPGCPDLLVFTPGPVSGKPTAIEMKSRSKHARVSPEQKMWLSRLKDNGWDTHVCKGAADALAILRAAGYADQPEKQPIAPPPAGKASPGRSAPVATAVPAAGGQSGGSPAPIAPLSSPAQITPRPASKQTFRPRWQPSRMARPVF